MATVWVRPTSANCWSFTSTFPFICIISVSCYLYCVTSKDTTVLAVNQAASSGFLSSSPRCWIYEYLFVTLIISLLIFLHHPVCSKAKIFGIQRLAAFLGTQTPVLTFERTLKLLFLFYAPLSAAV